MSNKEIRDIPRIHTTFDVKIDPENIREFIEEPLIEACLVFYEKGIKTFSSSANSFGQDPAYVIIDFDELTPGNQDVAKSLTDDISLSETDGKHYAKFSMDIEDSTPVENVVNWSTSIALKFNKQSAKWTQHFTIEEAYQMELIKDEDIIDGEVDVSRIEEKYGFVYSDNDGFFFMDQRDLDRYHQGDSEV